MKTAVCVGVLVALLAIGSTAQAQPFWEKKDWQKWSKSECEKMLTDSPWAKRFTATNVVNYPIGQSSGGTGRESRQEIEYTAQLRSALPVRQAAICMARIESGYDKMTPEEKKSFDAQAEQYLTQSFANRIVVHVEYYTNVQIYERELRRLWQTTPTGAVPQEAQLIGPKGERIDPVNFIVAPGGAREFELIFLRELEGRPLVGPDDKSFSLQLPAIAFYERRILIPFDVRKMKFKGELEY